MTVSVASWSVGYAKLTIAPNQSTAADTNTPAPVEWLKYTGLHPCTSVIRSLRCQLDVTDPKSMTQLAAQVEQEYSQLDILVNNAGILYDTWQQPSTADLDTVQEAVSTNTLGPLQMCKAFVPLLRHSHQGRIVNVPSGAGSIASIDDNSTPAYSVSNAALNAFTRSLAAELKGTGILVNAVCPVWVATDMGGSGGRPVEDGSASAVWVAMLPDDGPTGGFFSRWEACALVLIIGLACLEWQMTHDKSYEDTTQCRFKVRSH